MTRFEGLRIGLVGPLPPPAGGMANQTRQLGELLRAEGANVMLVQTNAPCRPEFLARVPLLRALARLLPYLGVLWRATGRVELLHVMANSGWSWHLFAVPAIWIAHLRGVRIVVNYRGGEAGKFLARSHTLVRWSMRRVDSLAVPSGFLEGTFARHGMHAAVVPNVIDLARFHPAGASRQRAAHIVVARNLEALYDNESALRAFVRVLERCPSGRLTIAGSGPEASRLGALARELGIEHAVRFTGRLDREVMAKLYRESDVVLNPSRADNMPNSLLEAMASGVPVVSTDVGGVPFMVQHEETALLVKAGDFEAMAAAIVRLIEDGTLWQRLSQAGLEQARRYSWPRVAPDLAKLYGAALQRG